jgi:quinol monooxygenase YgiN
LNLLSRPIAELQNLPTVDEGATTMYGLIGKMTTASGQRDALIRILLEGTGGMPGCLSYIIAIDPNEPDALWITEVWDDEASNKASLSLPSVQQAMAKGRPLIAGFSNRTVTTPVGGIGIAPKR